MKVIVTGTSNGIGKAIAEKFLKEGCIVIGLDKCGAPFERAGYTHYTVDISKDELPEIGGAEVLINNAGTQNSGEDIDVNLKATIRVTEKYAFRAGFKSVLFIASASASTGSEFPEYAASKGGVISYMKNVAMRIAPSGATANSLSPGGVMTKSNARVIQDEKMWSEIMSLTPLKKWAEEEEIAEFAFFLTVINKSMTAQDVLVDNGESANFKFVW